jgi:hypothetical protein
VKTRVIGMAIAVGIALIGSYVSTYGMGPGMGSGMMGGYGQGYGMGSGMTGGYNSSYGPGYGMNRGTTGGYSGNGQGTYERNKPVTKQETETILNNYIGGNPNLKVGNITDKGDHFEGKIVTRDDSLVAKLCVDKRNGFVTMIY